MRQHLLEAFEKVESDGERVVAFSFRVKAKSASFFIAPSLTEMLNQVKNRIGAKVFSIHSAIFETGGGAVKRIDFLSGCSQLLVVLA
jgi:hypothetical protein